MVSPKGLASYPFLNSPSTKFKEDGEYSVKVIVESSEAQEFIAKLKAVFKDAYREQCSLLKKDKLKMHDYPWSEQEDGTVSFKFAAKAKIRTREGQVYDKKVALFDTKGNPVTDLIGSNSMIKVAFDVAPWYVPSMGMGLSLRMKAVQVVELVAPSRNVSANSFGFTEEEEGYVSGGETFGDDVFSAAPEAAVSDATSGEDF